MDPNPIKHPAVLLARIRDAIEPVLAESGFQLNGRNRPPGNHGFSLWLDYTRAGETLSLRWDRWIARLAAELMDSRGNVRTVAEVTFDDPVQSHQDLMDRIDPFIAKAKELIRSKA